MIVILGSLAGMPSNHVNVKGLDRQCGIKAKSDVRITLTSDFALKVRLIGLEPTRRETPDPKSGASTNFATSA